MHGAGCCSLFRRIIGRTAKLAGHDESTKEREEDRNAMTTRAVSVVARSSSHSAERASPRPPIAHCWPAKIRKQRTSPRRTVIVVKL
ncbi:hypothetical protein EXIGLDRAFT_735120 [Exidia glandulosa HHB12029]|uniref:Uncharacterized protein n=1 Tax=Exidia glandulosa HHB12029 TaxID=1314781 RepID=A0A165AUE9_EXIGL|nr:hypothetical protein EXIGLDRAFT_735120 [Exidia glandulosa HHB12029]